MSARSQFRLRAKTQDLPIEETSKAKFPKKPGIGHFPIIQSIPKIRMFHKVNLRRQTSKILKNIKIRKIL